MVLVYLILMAQFASFSDPFVILLAVPPGLSGVLIFLLLTGTTLNVMSLMGVVMMTGIAVSDSILIVEFVGTLRKGGMELKAALAEACKVRLRPILMTTMATILGLIPMALAIEPGSEQYAPLARAILGGLTVSGLVTVFLVPTAYLLIHRNEESQPSRILHRRIFACRAGGITLRSKTSLNLFLLTLALFFSDCAHKPARPLYPMRPWRRIRRQKHRRRGRIYQRRRPRTQETLIL